MASESAESTGDIASLERAVVEAAISVAEGLREGCSLTRMQIWQRQGVLLSAVDALIAARKEGTGEEEHG